VHVDLVDLLALAILIAAVFVAARTWGQVTVPVSVALFALALVQALWVLGVIPALGDFGARTWAAIACAMLIVLGLWLAQVGIKRPAAVAAVVSVAAAVELLVLSGIVRLG
jgi:hypothetical protein